MIAGDGQRRGALPGTERGQHCIALKIKPTGIRFHFPYHLYFLDLAALSFTSLAPYVLLNLRTAPEQLIRYGLAVVIAMATYSLVGFANHLYDWRKFREHLQKPFATFQGVIFAFGSLLLIAFATKTTSDFSRLWISLWFSGFAAYILISRPALVWYLSTLKQNGIHGRRALILGASEHGQEVLDHILRFDSQDIQVIGFLDDRASRRPKAYRGVAVLGETLLAERLVREHNVDLIIVALPWNAYERIAFLIQKLSSWSLDIYMAPDKLGLQYSDRPVFRVGGMHVLSLQDRPISEWNAVVKRIEDLCLVIPAIVILSPLLALVALAIKLESKGDVFFIQDRFGFNNNLIKVYKFRSMYTHMTDVNAEKLTTKNDPRITRVGAFIRKTSIDELPQLFNVLNGSMSMVGPRPHATMAKADNLLYADVVAEYASRHRVKPGITGWAQCNGWRGETDTREKIEKRVEHDLYYIENWSIFLDLLTLFKMSLLLVRNNENAY